jgi:ABC-type multidrug transport system fused ATPase/permease subunit
MNFWKGFNIFWIIFLLFFSIGLPFILHYAGDHQLSDFEMIHTSAGEAFVLLGLGTAFWFIVFIYYIKQFLIHPLLKINGIIRLLGLLLLIALAAGILLYSYKNESHGYGWRYLYFWHPYVLIPGSFIFYSSLVFGTINGIFSNFLDKFVKN